MKLHLPSGLRKALLACLASLALPVTTFASGSAIFSSGALVSFLLSQSASGLDNRKCDANGVFADESEYTISETDAYFEISTNGDTQNPKRDATYSGNINAAGYNLQFGCHSNAFNNLYITGTLTGLGEIKLRGGGNVHITGSLSAASMQSGTAFSVSKGVKNASGAAADAAGTLYLDGEVSGLDSFTVNDSGISLHFTSTLNLEGSTTFDGTSNIFLDESGTLVGSDVAITKQGAGTLTLNGDMSGFTGSLNVEGGTVAFGSAATLTTLSGTGAVTIGNSVTLTLSDTTHSMGSINGGTLALASGSSLTLSSGASVLAGISGLSTLTLQNNASLTVNLSDGISGFTASGSGSLTFNITSNNKAFSGVTNLSGIATTFELGDNVTKFTLGESGEGYGGVGTGSLTINSSSNAEVVLIGGSTNLGVITLGSNVTLVINVGPGTDTGLKAQMAGLKGSGTLGGSTNQKRIKITSSGENNFSGTVSGTDGEGIKIYIAGNGSQEFSGTIQDKVDFSLEESGTLILSASMEGTTHGLTLNSGSIEFKGAHERNISSLSYGANGGSLKISQGTLNLNSSVTLSNANQTIELVKGSRLVLGSGAALSVANGTFTISGTGESKAVISLGITGASSESAILDLGSQSVDGLAIELDIVSSLYSQHLADRSFELEGWLTYSGASELVFTSIKEGWSAIWEDGKIKLTYSGPSVADNVTWAGGQNGDNTWTNEDQDSFGDNIFINGNNVTFNAAQAGTVNVSGGVSAGSMTVNGGEWTFSVASESDSITATSLSLLDSASITLDGAGTWTFSGISGSNGSITLKGGVLDLTNITGNLTSVALKIDVNGSGMLKASSLEPIASVTLFGIRNGTQFTLFAEEGVPQDFNSSHISAWTLKAYNTEGRERNIGFDYNENTRVITFTVQSLNLEWEGNSNLTWVDGVDGWADYDVFMNGDSVTFSAGSADSVTVTIGEAGVTAKDVTVSRDANYTFALGSNRLSMESLNVSGSLTLTGSATQGANDPAALTTGTLTGNGTLTYNATGGLSLGDASNFTGKLIISNTGFVVDTGTLTFGSGGSIEIQYGSDTLNNRTAIKGTLAAKLILNSAVKECLKLDGGTVSGDIVLEQDAFVQGPSGTLGSASSTLDFKGHTLSLFCGTSTGLSIEAGTLRGLSKIEFASNNNGALRISANIDSNSMYTGVTTLNLESQGGSAPSSIYFEGTVEGISGVTYTNNINSNGTVTFSSRLTVSGDFTFNNVQSGSYTGKTNYELSGTSTLVGGNSAKIIKDGANTLTLAGTMSGYSGGLEVKNGTVNVNSGVTFSGVKISGGSVVVGSNTTLGLSGSIQLTGGLLNLSGGSITVADSTSLSIAVGSYSTTNRPITLTVAQVGTLSTGLASITLTGENLTFSTEWSMKLWNLSGTGTVDDAVLKALVGKITNDPGPRYEFALASDGTLSVVISEATPHDSAITWNGGDDGEWSNGGMGWTSSDERFANTDDVIFQEGEDISQTVTIADAGVTTGKMTINSGTEWTFDGGDLVIEGEVFEYDGVVYLATAIEANSEAIIATFNNDVTLNGDINLLGSTTSEENETTYSSLTFAGNTTLSGDLDIGIMGVGHVVFNDLTGNSAGMALLCTEPSGGLIVEINNTNAANANLGGVEIGANSKVILNPNGNVDTAWGSADSSYFYGAGTLVIAGNNVSFTEIADGSNVIVKTIGTGDEHTLETMEVGIEGRSELAVGFKSNASEVLSALSKIKNLKINKGSELVLKENASAVFLAATEGANHVLHLAGTGGRGRETDNNAALSLECATDIGWNVQLSGDATVYTSGNATISGTYKGMGKVLTKTGTSSLTLQAIDADNLGDITVSAGTMKIELSSDQKVAKNIINNGNLNFSGGKTYTFETLSGSGSMGCTTAAADARVTLQIQNGETNAEKITTYTGGFGGKVLAKLTGGIWKFAGRADNVLTVDGSTAALTLGNSTLNNGLTVTSGSLSIAGGSTVSLGGGTFDVAGATGISIGSSTTATSLSIAVAGYSATKGADSAPVLRMTAAQLGNLVESGLKLTLTGTQENPLNLAMGFSLYLLDITSGDATDYLEGLVGMFTNTLTEGYEFVVDEDGILKVALSEVRDLVWASGIGTWQDGQAGQWTYDGASVNYGNYNNAIFGNSTTSTGTVTLGGNVIAENMTVNGNFSFVLGANSLTVDKKLTINNGAVMEVTSGTGGALHANGGIDLGGTLKIGTAGLLTNATKITAVPGGSALVWLTYNSGTFGSSEAAAESAKPTALSSVINSSYTGAVKVSAGCWKLGATDAERAADANLGLTNASAIYVDGNVGLEVFKNNTWSGTLYLNRETDFTSKTGGIGALTIIGNTTLGGNIVLQKNTRIQSTGTSTINANLNAGGNTLQFAWGTVYLNGTLTDLGKIDMVPATVYITGALTNENMWKKSTTFHFVGTGGDDGNARALHLQGAVSGFTEIKVNTENNKLNQLFIDKSLAVGTSGLTLNVGNTGNRTDSKLELSGDAALSGAAEITKQGNGQLVLLGDTSKYTGTLNVTAGSVRLGNRTIFLGALKGAGTIDRNANTDAPVLELIGTNADASSSATISNTALVKKGSNTQTLTGNFANSASAGTDGAAIKVVDSGALKMTGNVTATGDLRLDNTANFIYEAGSQTNSMSVSGELAGASGTLTLANGGLTLTGGGETGVTLDLRGNSTLTLGANLTVAGISNATTWVPGDTEYTQTINKTTGAANTPLTLTLDVSTGAGTVDSAKAANLQLATGITLVKKGEGTQTLHGLKADLVQVTGGTLALAESRWDSNKQDGLVSTIEVSNGSTLELRKTAWEAAEGGTTLSLSGSSSLKLNKEVADNSAVGIKLKALELGSGNNTIVWSQETGQQELRVKKLTGEGNLNVGTALQHDSDARYQRVVLESLVDVHGTITAGLAQNGEGEYGEGGLYVGAVSQDDGKKLTINGLTYVTRDTMLKKTGAGELEISSLKVHGASGGVQMTYAEGNFSVEEIELESGANFHYGDEDKLLHWNASALEALTGDTDHINLNFAREVEIEEEVPYDLGIVDDGDYASDTAFLYKLRQQLIQLDNIEYADDSGYVLSWIEDETTGEKRLHMTLRDFTVGEPQWDRAWGIESAPGSGTMKRHEYSGNEEMLALETVFNGEFNESPTRNLIRIIGGGSETATVIGGARYVAGDKQPGRVAGDSWISLREAEGESARYHMLVGGSSCELATGELPGEETREKVGGFVGDSHIQMDGGEVDYIVGGNHVTNSAFRFAGSSFISVYAGSQVNGGIVGGSTLTRGSAAENEIYEFGGNSCASHIYIYAALSNGSGATPGISVGGSKKGAAFAAVVGGNAWVEQPARNAETDMAPTFKGDAKIEIDLTDADKSAHGVFEKDIVGGNYTAFKGAGDPNTNRSTIFEGNTEITITASDALDTFTGGISGASRRASAGGGATQFTGTTEVTLNGGTYTEAVAGGMWFEESASGDHSSELNGDTQVTVNSGNLWRVVGGSYSLQGGSSAGEVQDGNSRVTINGGSFASKGTTQQTDIGFVAGGDFYRNNSGTEHSRTEGTEVIINGGSFDRVHIVGGDYANASTPSGEAQNRMVTSITGATSVTLGGENAVSDVKIVGLVAGGSYLTDEGAGGTVEVKGGTSISIGERAELNGNDGHPLHKSLAVVGGHVLIDDGNSAGGHSAIVGKSTRIAMTGGSVTGDIVGGSYANASAGTNMLDSADVTIELQGGTVTGNIYGGHYTESTTVPDELSVGNIRIDVAGGEVVGNIVGGGHRATTQDNVGHSEQGDIELNLTTGKLTGNIYAAGYNAATAAGTAATTTASATVTIGMDFEFAAGTPDAHSSEGSILISGGYGRQNTGFSRGTVTGESKLVFTGANDSINTAAARGESVTLANFDTVEVQSESICVDTDVYVMSRGADSRFTKAGAGTLSVNSLVMWNEEETEALAYTGKICLAGGILELTGAEAKSIEGGLVYDLNGLTKNNAESAYLRATGGGVLAIGSGKKATLELEVGTSAELQVGFYYLASGLQAGITQETLASYFDYDLSVLEEMNENYAYDLLVQGDCLILSVKDGVSSDKWVWWGEESDSDGSTVWSDESTNWNQDTELGAGGETPNGKDVYFQGEGAENVAVKGTVAPRSVWVKKGKYEFVATDENDGGLNIGAVTGSANDGELNKGELAVGVPGGYYEAELKLSLRNTNINQVSLHEGGTLVLNHAEAVQEDTYVLFDGGTLGYDAGAVGGVDVSSKVSATAGSIARIRVGEVDAAAEATDLRIAWGGKNATTATNAGLRLALQTGIEKTGKDTFALEWKEAGDARIAGSIAARQGTLEYVVHSQAGHVVSIGGAGSILIGNATSNPAPFAMARAVAAEEATSATLVFSFAKGEEGEMDVDSAFTGDGTAQLGSAEDAGSYVLKADNSLFAGTIRLVGGEGAEDGLVTAAVAGALGGEYTTLALAGRNFVFAEGLQAVVRVKAIHAEEGATTYVGGTQQSATNAAILLDSAITGSGTLANAESGFDHTITGSLDGFTGAIVAGAAGVGESGDVKSTWTLVGSAGSDLQASLAGAGSILLNYDGNVRLTGRIGADDAANNDVTLQTVGNTVATIAGGDNTGTGLLSGSFRLGDAAAAGTWAGSSLAGSLTLVNGSLTSGISQLGQGSVLTVETAQGGTTVHAGGTEGKLIQRVVIRSGGHLAGVSGGLSIGGGEGQTTAWLYFGGANVGSGAGSASTDYLLDVAGGVAVDDTEKLVLDFSAEGFVGVLESVLAGGNAYLHVSHQGLTIDPSDYLRLLGAKNREAFENESLVSLLCDLGFYVQDVQGGDVILSGSLDDVYLVLDPATNGGKAHTVNGYNVLSAYKATVVGADQELTLNLSGAPEPHSVDGVAGAAVVNNLVGLAGSTFRIVNTDAQDGETPANAERVRVALNNIAQGELADNSDYPEQSIIHTTFKGSIIGERGVDLQKTGSGVLTVGEEGTDKGGLQLADGDVSLSGGALRLAGGASSARSLTFAWKGEAADGEQRDLTLSGKKTSLTLESIYETDGKGGDIYLKQGAELQLKSVSELEDARITAGGDAEGGLLSIASGARLSLVGAGQQLAGISAEVNGTLHLGSGSGNELSVLTGSGHLSGKDADLTLTGAGSKFAGQFYGSGVLTVASGASLELAKATIGDRDAGTGRAWTLRNAGELTIDTTTANVNDLYFEDLTLLQGSTTTLLFDTDRGNDVNGGLVTGKTLTIEEGAKLVVKSSSEAEITAYSISLGTFDEGTADTLHLLQKDITLSGMSFLHSEVSDIYYDNGVLKLQLRRRTSNPFATGNMEKNSLAGAEMLWELADQRSEGWKFTQDNPNGDLHELLAAVTAAYEQGSIDTADMHNTLAAAAGVSTAVLSSALAQDVRRQLGAMRNRSSQSEPAYKVGSRGLDFHLWLTAETAYHKMDADGMAPGYTLNGWGGSVGMDVDVSTRTTLGLALTAMYNDLKTGAADAGKGDVDTTYLSAYARTSRGSWVHTFVASVGTADVTLNRTVRCNYNFGLSSTSYNTHGSTDGYAAGAMYEVGYSFMLNRAGTMLLQPVFNVQYSHSSLSGYTESGSDAGLRVGGVQQNQLTLGLGARMQSALGENAFNRVALFEARALLKADVGDRTGKANTAFANAGHSVEVESAELGAVGIELGAGVSLPLGKLGGTIFMDGSAEFRSGYSNFSASAGYRINF